jgi:hypothetical protein
VQLRIYEFDPIDDPTAEDIADGLASLSGIEDGFAILNASQDFGIQCSGHPDAGFYLECYEGGHGAPRRTSSGPNSLARMTEAFQRYATADPEWDEHITWDPQEEREPQGPIDPSPKHREKLVERSSGAIIIGRSWLFNGLAIALLILGLWGVLGGWMH